MKLDWQTVQPGGEGRVLITIDHIEDFWTIVAIIHPGDCVRAQVRRKIKTVRTGTGKTEATTNLLFTKVRIEEIDFQPGAEELRLRGTLVHDIEGGKAGTYQRVMLGVGRPFTLSKSLWDDFTIEVLREAADPVANATVSAVLMASGVANVCLIGRNATRIVDHVEKAIPKVRKMGDSGKNQEARDKFFDLVARSLVAHIAVSEMRCIIFASPGFLAREFFRYLSEHKSQLEIPAAFQEDKFIVATSTGPHLDALDQLLLLPEISARIEDLKAVTQARAWDHFQKVMSRDVNMVSIGPRQVTGDLKLGAVKTLLVTDSYIMGLPFQARLQFIQLKDGLMEEGCEVVRFGSTHPTGQQLTMMSGGIVAILKYAIVRADADFDAPFDDTA
jgi:protein pelota